MSQSLRVPRHSFRESHIRERIEFLVERQTTRQSDAAINGDNTCKTPPDAVELRVAAINGLLKERRQVRFWLWVLASSWLFLLVITLVRLARVPSLDASFAWDKAHVKIVTLVRPDAKTTPFEPTHVAELDRDKAIELGIASCLSSIDLALVAAGAVFWFTLQAFASERRTELHGSWFAVASTVLLANALFGTAFSATIGFFGRLYIAFLATAGAFSLDGEVAISASTQLLAFAFAVLSLVVGTILSFVTPYSPQPKKESKQ